MSYREKHGQLRRELRFSRETVESNLKTLGLDFQQVTPLISALGSPNGLLTLEESELTLVERVLGTQTENPAVSLFGELVLTKSVPAGTGVSYGYISKTDSETNLGLVGLGFSDGIPRSASNRLSVRIGSGVFRSIGRIAMDQTVIDLGATKPELGAEVCFFGDHCSLVKLSFETGFTPLEILGRIAPRVARLWI